MDDHYDSESASKGRRWTSRSALIVIVATAFVVPALAVAGKVADIGDLANYASDSSVAQPSSAPDLSRASKLVSTTLKQASSSRSGGAKRGRRCVSSSTRQAQNLRRPQPP